MIITIILIVLLSSIIARDDEIEEAKLETVSYRFYNEVVSPILLARFSSGIFLHKSSFST